jgi:hypothetical protein
MQVNVMRNFIMALQYYKIICNAKYNTRKGQVDGRRNEIWGKDSGGDRAAL